MKTAICYYSRHHGNTKKLLQAMAEINGADLIDVTLRQGICLEKYDCIGLASGIYYGKFHTGVRQFARQYLPPGKGVFFVCTYGIRRPGYTKAIAQIAAEKGCPILGQFGCKGYDTFGPFKLLGGIAKNHPNQRDLENGRRFYQNILQAYEQKLKECT